MNNTKTSEAVDYESWVKFQNADKSSRIFVTLDMEGIIIFDPAPRELGKQYFIDPFDLLDYLKAMTKEAELCQPTPSAGETAI